MSAVPGAVPGFARNCSITTSRLLLQVGQQHVAHGGGIARGQGLHHLLVFLHGAFPLLAVLVGAEAQRLQAGVDLVVGAA